MSLTIHIMTATLAPGDAIGNYILSLCRLLPQLGCRVALYADFTNPAYPVAHRHSSAYQGDGSGILWMHYSIYSDNLHWLTRTRDYVIMDYHGVSPPALFAEHNSYLRDLCARAIALLPHYAPAVDLAIVHTDYTYDELRSNGFGHLRKVPLVVDTARFSGAGDPRWEALLSPLRYLLFVGRVVPQKGLRRSLEIFAALRAKVACQYFIVGSYLLPSYAHELVAYSQQLGIADDVVFTGPVAEPAILTSLYRHAQFYLCLSEWESFCVPIIEALHFGTPVLGHNLAPIPETSGPGGLIIEGTSEQVASQIMAVWDDPVAYQALQAAGQAHAAKFTDQSLLAHLTTLFTTIAKEL